MFTELVLNKGLISRKPLKTSFAFSFILIFPCLLLIFHKRSTNFHLEFLFWCWIKINLLFFIMFVCLGNSFAICVVFLCFICVFMFVALASLISICAEYKIYRICILCLIVFLIVFCMLFIDIYYFTIFAAKCYLCFLIKREFEVK